MKLKEPTSREEIYELFEDVFKGCDDLRIEEEEIGKEETRKKHVEYAIEKKLKAGVRIEERDGGCFFYLVYQ